MPTYEICTPEEAEKIETARRSLAAHAERVKLRDQFAAAALTGLLGGGSSRPAMDAVPKAWELAAAMLEARDRVHGGRT